MRDIFFDSLKGALIILVVFGHFLAYGLSNRVCLTAYNYLYMFHMPLFVAVSGFFSNPTHPNYWRRTFGLLESYIVFQIIMLLCHNVSFSIKSLLTPQFGLWYLLSLFFWRSILAYINPGISHQKSLLLFAVLIGLLGGIIPVSQFLSIQRSFYFFPFFIAGLCVRDMGIMKIFQRKEFGWISVGVIVISLFVTWIMNMPFYIGFLGRDHYSLIWEGMMIRLIRYLISFALSATFVGVFYMFFPFNNYESFLSMSGKSSLIIYLFHLFIVQFASFLPKYLLTYFLSAFFLVGVLSYLSKYSFVKYILNPISSILSSQSSNSF